ncbi:MAG: Asp-tRNA(Asn)/Glu-tRNA(Gln) amidotransferase subunit GatC [Candidatus Pacebacteria bacterium]|nr:Asp-tRNA(Asn)/Glu-tRNA(Gln) amidotransferase subunit GatC [Candidatus Paceibacterota bacterium]
MTDGPKVDIKALADLARVEISDVEMAKLEKEIPDILKFVEQIQGVATDTKPVSPELRNVMRTDEHPHATGEYTERILKAAPAQKDNRVVVKQVVTRKQK